MMQRVLWTACLLIAALAGVPPAAAQTLVASVPVPGGDADVAIDATRNLVYVAASSTNSVGILDAATRQVTSVAVGRRPKFVAVNTATNRIYASNTDDFTLSVIDGATRSVATLPIGGAGPIVVNERTNKIYVMRRGNNGEVTVVDGATNTWYTMDTGSYVPWSMVLNPATNTLYVSHVASGDVRVIDLSSTSDHPPSLSVQIPGRPSWLAFDPRANKVWVQTDDSTTAVVAIDAATNAATRIAAPGVVHGNTGIGVNPATGRVYVGSNPQAAVIDGASGAVIAYLPLANLNHFVADPATNRIYALRDGNAVVVIDGATNVFTEVKISRGTGAIALNTATHLAFTAATDIVDGGAATPAPAHGNYQGMWWNAPAGSQPGWGLALTQQGEKIFAAWFIYDDSATPVWYVATGDYQGNEVWSGTLYRSTGPAFTAPSFDSAAVSAQAVGALLVSFSDGNNGVMRGSLNGQSFQKSITRQVFGPLPVCEFSTAAPTQPNYTALWWNSPAGSESGWGLSITHQGDNAFAVWFTYDAGGRPVWLVGNAVRNGAVYQGTLYQSTGEPFSGNGRSPYFTATPIGSITLNFSDAGNGSFAYSAFAARGFKAITREIFANPPTVCR